ncbi:MAG: hypothetical protein JJ693_06120 [Acidithiobacillus sp.]|nr:hypothetical protein [Acidithiobacillus sp.]
MKQKMWVQSLLSLGLVLPSAAWALGLGSLVVLSGPGEPFRAEIPIHTSHPNELTNLSARLADSSAYAMIHLPVAASTQHWQFSVRRGENPAILITSPLPLGPGATPFLVQLDWAGGQMVREYQAYPGSNSYGVPKQSVLPTTSSLGQMPASPARAKTDTTPALARPQSTSFGPVPKGSSLYQIARQVNPNTNVQQVMAAIFRANPQAFIQGNPNLLSAGVMLRLPSTQDIQAISPAQAAALLHRPKHMVPKPQAPAATAPSVSPTAKVQSAVVTTPSSSQAATTLRLSSAPAALTQSAETTAPVQSIANPVAAVSDQQLQQLQASLHGMEERLHTAQAQIAAQAAQISELSRHQGEKFPLLLWVSLGGNLLLLLLFLWIYRQQQLSLVRQREISSKLTSLSASNRSSASVSRTLAPQAVPPAPAVPAASPSTAQAMPTPTSVAAPTPTSTGAATAAATLSAATAAPTPSPVAADQPTTALPATSSALQEEDEQDSFQVDPIEQADLYQTYGKIDQAITVLQEALEVNPRRRDLYSRLLSLYGEAGRREDFLALAERMRSRFGPNNPDWQTVAATGERLFPGNPLFTRKESNPVANDAVPSASSSASAGPKNDPLPAALDFDLGKAFSESAPDPEGPSAVSMDPAASPKDADSIPWSDAHRQLLEEVDAQFRALDNPPEQGTAEPEQQPESHPSADVGLSPESTPTEFQSTGMEWDAIGTKLDLAKAYVEMADKEAARELLEEIVREGNPEQRDEATQLLARL